MDEISSLSFRQAALNLGVSERHVAKLIAEPILPSYRLGRRRLIRREALRQFLERRETIVR